MRHIISFEAVYTKRKHTPRKCHVVAMCCCSEGKSSSAPIHFGARFYQFHAVLCSYIVNFLFPLHFASFLYEFLFLFISKHWFLTGAKLANILKSTSVHVRERAKEWKSSQRKIAAQRRKASGYANLCKLCKRGAKCKNRCLHRQ